MSVELRILQPGDEAILANVDPDTFDNAIVPEMAAAFLRDPHHVIAVAIAADLVVGFASGVVYLHPDKVRPELWINEVGVAESHHRRGLGRSLMHALFAHGQAAGCDTAWVLTERDNEPAQALYRAVGGEEPEVETVLFTFDLGAEEDED